MDDDDHHVPLTRSPRPRWYATSNRGGLFWGVTVLVGAVLTLSVGTLLVVTAIDRSFVAPPPAAWAAFARVIGRRSHAYTCGTSFYEYACPDDLENTSTSTFVALADRVSAQLDTILVERWPLVGTWFAACMNTTARVEADLTALEPLLGLIASVTSVETFSRAVARLHRAGAPALFSAYVAADELAPTTEPRVLYLDALDALLPVEMWQNNASSLALAAHGRVVDLVTALIGATAGAQALSVDEEQLAPHVPSAAARRSAPPADRDVQWADLPAGAFDWLAYADELYGASPPTVAVRSRDYLTAAVTIGQHNDWSTVRAYLFARLLVSVVDDLPVANTTVDACAASVEEALGDVLGHYYVRAYFDAAAAKPLAASIVNAVIRAFEHRLAVNTWMDAPTRVAAIAKAAAIRPEVAFPDGDWSVRLPTYAILEDAHLANVLAARADAASRNLDAAGRAPPPPGTEPHWLMSEYVVNAYYEPSDNDIVFPAGILQGSFFHVDAPLAVNYGGLGAVAGHEITHAFDDQGREYDGTGARRDWWSPVSAALFEQRATCVVDLYSACREGDEHVNGALTLGENLADLGGLPTAYAAYLAALAAERPSWRRRYKADVERVFGMTHDQLFFAAYAHTWCTRHRSPDLAYLLLHVDPHSPPRWRVDIPTSQTPEFAHVFHCPAPEAPCAVW